MAAQIYRLVMRTGPTPGKTYDLVKGEITIGRDPASDIPINELEVSRKHVILTAQAGGYVMEDVGSTNGTFVNGQRLMGPHSLHPDELILLGEKVSLVVEQVTLDADATGVVVPGAQPAPAQVEPVSALPVQPAGQMPVTAAAEPGVPETEPAPGYISTFSTEIPSGPDDLDLPLEEESRGLNRSWFLAGCGCMVLLVLIIVIAGLFYIDAGGTERWCRYFSFLFSAGECP